MSAASRKRGVGCLLALAIYIPAFAIMFFVTRPDEVTEDFTGKNARIFSIATVHEQDGGIEYRRTTLETIGNRVPELAGLVFMLPETEIVIDTYDIHHVSVLEDHGHWQLIEFSYANTYTSTSVYRAYEDRVEPVSFQITSHVGQAMMGLVLIVPVYFIAWLITFVRKRRARN